MQRKLVKVRALALLKLCETSTLNTKKLFIKKSMAILKNNFFKKLEISAPVKEDMYVTKIKVYEGVFYDGVF